MISPASLISGRVTMLVVQVWPVKPGVQVSSSTSCNTGWCSWKDPIRTEASGAAMNRSIMTSEGATKAANVLNFMGQAPGCGVFGGMGRAPVMLLARAPMMWSVRAGSGSLQHARFLAEVM